MLETLKGLAGIIVVFGLVIFIHELGHFLAAKFVGVYAPRFSIGFGRALWSRKWGETEYILAAIPLGGYVRMASREDETMARLEGGNEEPLRIETVGANSAEVAEHVAPKLEETKPRYWDPNGMAPFGPKPVPPHRLFESKPLPARLLIMIAGVTMNILLAFVLYTAIEAIYGRAYVASRVVGTVLPAPGVPELEALAAGDTVSTVDGQRVRHWQDLEERIVTGTPEVLRIGTHRGEVVIPAATSERRRAVALAIGYPMPPVFGDLQPGEAGAKAGLRPGDSVVTIDGAPVATWNDVTRTIRASPERELTFEVVRGGARHTIRVVPRRAEEPAPSGGGRVGVGRLGVIPQGVEPDGYDPVGAGDAVRAGWRSTWGMAGLIVTVIKRWVTGEASAFKELGGPIAIATASAQAAQGGIQTMMGLLALLSINVAIFNLLPIPILDGGQIVLNIVEAARGRSFSERTREYILRFGLLAIVMLLAVGTFNDVSNFLRRLFG